MRKAKPHKPQTKGLTMYKTPIQRLTRPRALSRLALLTCVVLLSAALGLAPSAFGQAFQINQPISFTLNNSQCVPRAVQGSGEEHLVINERVDANGGTNLQINDLSNGRATDSAGGTYT